MGKREQMGTQVPGSLVSRVAAGFRYALTGNPAGVWFGPMDPVPAAVPEGARESAGLAGRQFDYPVGFNVNWRPRQGEPYTFETLRALAENFDLLRTVIETRKDQVCAATWSVQPRDAKERRQRKLRAASRARAQHAVARLTDPTAQPPELPEDPPDPGRDRATELLLCPDGAHAWDEWIRMLLEDLFVLDAPTVYVRPTLGGGPAGFDPIDGATIKPVIDATGRRPAEGPAYQQVIKGVAAADFTSEEMIYKPRNVRTHKVYGYGPVEQIIRTVDIALRRNLFVKQYFTEGSVPDALAGVPEEWTTEQIGKFQMYWDGLLAAEDQNTAPRRKLRFVPGKIAQNFKETKAPPLKDEFDEWLARIVCYCFSIDVTPFVAQINRATADVNREQSLTEGLGPTLRWCKSLADDVLRRAGLGDYELMWEKAAVADPLKRAQVNKIYLDAKVLHPDEVREDLGKDPMTPEQRADLAPPPTLPQGGGDDGGPPGSGPPKPKEAGAYLGKALRPARRANAKSRMARAVASFLEGAASAARRAVSDCLASHAIKARRPTGGDVTAIAEAAARAAVEAMDWESMFDDASSLLAEIAAAAGADAAAQVGSELAADALAAVRDRAESWARDRAAEMVGMRATERGLVPNPDARWAISDTTREAVREAVRRGLADGLPAAEVAAAVAEDDAFSPERALAVARTEMARADSQGQLAGWGATGVVAGKAWTTAGDDLVSDECAENEDAGDVGLEDDFPSGDSAPPAHPNCRCALVPVLLSSEGE